MNAKLQARFETRARVIKSLAHPTRLYLVEILTEGERCVTDLTQIVGADVSTVSKHLSLLKASGVVKDRKEGLKVIYCLKTPCVLKFFDCIEEVLRASAKAQMACLDSPCDCRAPKASRPAKSAKPAKGTPPASKRPAPPSKKGR